MELELQAIPASASTLRDHLSESLAALSVDPVAVGDFALAVTEAFINAVEHGVRNPQDRVCASLEADGRSGVVELRYAGAPFEADTPAQLPPPEALNGRGRYLMRVLTDGVEYCFRNGVTRVRLQKHWR